MNAKLQSIYKKGTEIRLNEITEEVTVLKTGEVIGHYFYEGDVRYFVPLETNNILLLKFLSDE